MAPSTRRAYATGERSFTCYCQSMNRSPWPASSDLVEDYVTHLFNTGIASSTLSVYLSAIARYHVMHNWPDPTQSARLKAILEGARRMNGVHQDQRLPITPDLLRQLHSRLHLTSNQHIDQRMFGAAFTLAHHFLLRVSEYTSISPARFNPDATLCLDDVHYDRTMLRCTIKQSKTDQRRNGVTLTMQRAESPFVHDVCTGYSEIRRLLYPANFPFFMHASGRFLTRSDVTEALKKCLPDSCDRMRYSSHSFRIGGATAAAADGQPVDAICKKGRWKSASFQRYIRPFPNT
ncbi:uncharacterized protein LOC129587968 [Paramacrobiotus metropolitanus]|uniref:uncharacterized protein LOC129587968 n=1 Tax=Paramacrobiotus metropolitanus TaxID=2943436 RepID=UPI0024464386|nr:uncharacterized protein LOC129587968 [Paramacrobiotus metropolitanus]